MRKIVKQRSLDVLDCDPELSVRVKLLACIRGKEDTTCPAVGFTVETESGLSDVLEFSVDLGQLRAFLDCVDAKELRKRYPVA